MEDNLGDVELMAEILKENRVHSKLHVVEDGEEVMPFLRREGKYADVPRPDLILLDLNLPKKGGLEVLAEIKADEYLKPIPVIVLSISEAPKDIIKAYKLNANCSITKPMGYERLTKVVRAIEDFWLYIAKLPSECAN